MFDSWALVVLLTLSTGQDVNTSTVVTPRWGQSYTVTETLNEDITLSPEVLAEVPLDKRLDLVTGLAWRPGWHATSGSTTIEVDDAVEFKLGLRFRF